MLDKIKTVGKAIAKVVFTLIPKATLAGLIGEWLTKQMGKIKDKEHASKLIAAGGAYTDLGTTVCKAAEDMVFTEGEVRECGKKLETAIVLTIEAARK